MLFQETSQAYSALFTPQEILPHGLMVWHLILDQEVLGSNPSEAALQKHIKEHYVLRYDSRRNVFYFNKIIKHKGNFARFNAGWSQCVLRYSEYTKMAFSGLILSTHLVLTYR